MEVVKISHSVMKKRIREFCEKCDQVTTFENRGQRQGWSCLCCESAEGRTAEEMKAIKGNGANKKKLNLKF